MMSKENTMKLTALLIKSEEIKMMYMGTRIQSMDRATILEVQKIKCQAKEISFKEREILSWVLVMMLEIFLLLSFKR